MSKESNLLEALRKDLKKFSAVLKQASTTIIDEDVSKYPIFIVHRHSVNMGIPLIEPKKYESNWSFNASTLEEFVSKNLIENAKVEDFKKIYKTPDEFLCLFVVEDNDANFIFAPYASRELNN